MNKLKYILKRKYDLPKKFKLVTLELFRPFSIGIDNLYRKVHQKITEIQAQEKEYTGTILVGATTPSYDLETEIDATFPTEHITEELILETTKQFFR